MRLLYQDSHKMADITDISDDEFEEIPVRKPIGWNYQNSNKSELMEGKIMGQNSKIISGEGMPNSKTMARIPSSDDIEVLEIVDIKNSSKPKPLFPESSSRKDLIKLSRTYSKQSFIEKYLNSDQGKNSKLSLSKRYVKLESSSLKIEKVLNPRNNSSENNNTSNIHNGNGESAIISKNISSPNENETKETLVNPIKPECPLVRIEFSFDNEKEESVKPEASKKDVDATAIVKDKSLAIPGNSATTKEVDSDITSEYSKSLIERFIDKWKCLEGFGGDDFLICDKLWKYYNFCHSTYTHSRKFCNGLNKAISDINASNKYVLIKDIIDTMKRYKETPYIEKKSLKSSQEVDNVVTVLSEEDMRNQRKLKRLEMAMIKIHKKIADLEMEEVDLDDDENSSYLLLDRLKAHFMKLDDKYCKLANCSTATGRPVEKKFKYEGSRYSEINQRITAWVNKHREFPEFVDVLKLVKEVTKNSCLPMRPETVRVEAQEIFRDVGKMLKNRRQKDDFFSIYAYAGEDLSVDPAEADPDLYKQLKLNGKEAKEKLDKVFNHFYEKDLEEREKTDTKNKKDGNVEKVASLKENKIEDKQNEESNLTEEKSDKNDTDSDEESVTNHNDESDINFGEGFGTISESEGVIDDEEEILESCSESDPNTVDSVENGRLTDTNGNNDIESEASELKVKNSSFEAGYERISIDISDTSDDEDIIETASNDSLLPHKELDTNIEDERNGNLIKSEQNDVSSECSEEDILIADSPDILEENYENVSSYRPVGTSNVFLTNSRKRKLDFPSNVSKKSHIESSPEIVELD